MLTNNEVAQVFDTILSIPGMNDTVRIDLKLSRKNAFILHHVISRGLELKDDEKGMTVFANAPEESLAELKEIAVDCLSKAGLVELNEKLSELSQATKK